MQSPKKNQSYIFVAIMFMAFFVAIIAYLFLLYIDALEEAQAGRDRIIEMRVVENERIINELSFGLNLLVEENQSVAEKIIEEREKRAEEAAESASQIEKLQEDLENSKAPNLSEIVSYWDPRVAKVKCNFEDGNAEGSAVLSPKSTVLSVKFASNRHIFEESGKGKLESCTLTLPKDSKVYTVTGANINFNADEDIDSVLIDMPSPSAQLLSLVSQGSPICTTTPSIGDSIVILGYPNVGSKTSITATEGIISGTENDFYITSAKVEKGNSGGAAIYADENCYLGTPTFTAKGQVESLARILKHQKIFQ